MTDTPQDETDFYARTQVQAARLRALPAGAGGLDGERLAEPGPALALLTIGTAE